MNILLTGSSSFIGRHLLPLMHKGPWQVWHLMRKSKGLSNEILWDFQSAFPADIPKFDIIVHLAAKAYFGPDLDLEQYVVNTISTGALASLAKRNNAFFIFASAAIVHGDAVVMGRSTPLMPLSQYAMTKVLAEEIIRQWTQDYVFLRIAGIYGLDGPEHLGLNRSISQAYYNRVVPKLKGNGEARRNYICVNDVAKWIEALIYERASGVIPKEKILYLGGPEMLTVKEYLTSVANVLTNFKHPILEQGLPVKDFMLEADLPAFKMTTFEEYLNLLAMQREKHV